MTLSPTERTRLAEDNLPLVRGLANRLLSRARPYLERDDLIAVGTEALLRAARRFDPERGVSFTSFVYLRVRGAMLESIGLVGPHSRGKVRRRAGRPESSRVLPTICPFDDRRVSLHRTEEIEQALTSAIDNARFASRIDRAIDELDRNDQVIIRRHYFGGDSLLDIGRDLGRSKSWASRVHSRALSRLRDSLERTDSGARNAPEAAAFPA